MTVYDFAGMLDNSTEAKVVIRNDNGTHSHYATGYGEEIQEMLGRMDMTCLLNVVQIGRENDLIVIEAVEI